MFTADIPFILVTAAAALSTGGCIYLASTRNQLRDALEEAVASATSARSGQRALANRVESLTDTVENHVNTINGLRGSLRAADDNFADMRGQRDALAAKLTPAPAKAPPATKPKKAVAPAKPARRKTA